MFLFVILSVGRESLVLIVMDAETTRTTMSTERTTNMMGPAVTERMAGMAVTAGIIRRVGDMPKKITVSLSELGASTSYPPGAVPRKPDNLLKG